MASGHEQTIWNYFVDKIGNEYGTAGLMGNLQAESALIPNNVQNGFGWSDEDYTSQVDSGAYSESQFVNDSIGYGLAQWTFSSRKQALYDMYKSGNYSSIGSIDLAMDYLWYELQYSYPGVLAVLKSATSVREASDSVLHDFESPKDQSEAVEVARAALGAAFYEEFTGTSGGGGGDDSGGDEPGGITTKKRKKFNFVLFNRQRRMMIHG